MVTSTPDKTRDFSIKEMIILAEGNRSMKNSGFPGANLAATAACNYSGKTPLIRHENESGSLPEIGYLRFIVGLFGPCSEHGCA